MVSLDSTTDHKRNWNREVYFSQVLEELSGLGPDCKVKVKTEIGRQDLGYMLLLGSVGRVFWSSWAKARMVNSKLESRVLVSPWESYLRIDQGKALGGRGDCWSQGLLRKSYQELPFLWLCGLLSRKCNYMKDWCSSRSMQATRPNKMVAKATIPLSSSAKLSTLRNRQHRNSFLQEQWASFRLWEKENHLGLRMVLDVRNEANFNMKSL